MFSLVYDTPEGQHLSPPTGRERADAELEELLVWLVRTSGSRDGRWVKNPRVLPVRDYRRN